MSYHVHIQETDERFSVNGDESILDASFRAGIKMAHECQFGGCGTCRIKVLDGAIRYEEFPMGLSEEEDAQGYALACQARPLSNLVISSAKKQPDFAPPSLIEARIHAIGALSADVIHLRLELPRDQPVTYVPGQYMNIVLDDGSSRSFSMDCASAKDQVVEFHVRRIAGGHFTERLLPTLQAGAPLSVEIPHGVFCYHEEDWRPLIMVATGTGIAPIKAVLESLLDRDDCPPVSLYWGMRTEEELYIRETIESWKGRLYEFDFVPVLSRAAPNWSGRRGHVQHAVAEDFEDLSEHAIYLCGSPDMIVEAKSLFARQGASIDHIYSDSFTFQRPVALVA